jgi:hypothetical protein
MSIVHLELEQPPSAFEERKQSRDSVEDVRRERVAGKCCRTSFPGFFEQLDPINRYSMIWILNGRTPWDNHDNWIDYLFLYCDM